MRAGNHKCSSRAGFANHTSLQLFMSKDAWVLAISIDRGVKTAHTLTRGPPCSTFIQSLIYKEDPEPEIVNRNFCVPTLLLSILFILSMRSIESAET